MVEASISTLIVFIIIGALISKFVLSKIKKFKKNKSLKKEGKKLKKKHKASSSPTFTIIVNKDLKMSTGKIISQTSHLFSELYSKLRKVKSFKKWKEEGQAKIVLKGSEEQIIEILKTEKQNDDILVLSIFDAGRTQIKSGSLTCIGLFGDVSDVKPKTSHLKLF